MRGIWSLQRGGNKKMRMGVVGALGYQGRKHAEELLSLDVEVVMCDVRGNVQYRDYTKMKHLDAVVIATPNSTHFAIAGYFLERNVPILVEKPLTKKYESAKDLVSFAKSKQTVLTTGSIFSFNNSVKAIGEIIKSGLLGKIEFVKCSWCSQMEPWAEKDIFLDLGPHIYDVLCSWNLEPAEYDLYTTNSKHKLIFTGSRNVEIEMKLSWIEGPKERSVKVVGDRYILKVDVLNQDVFVYEGNELIVQKTHTEGLYRKGFGNYLQFARNNTLRDELKGFLKQIEEGPNYRLAEQGVRFLKWKESKGIKRN